MVLSPRPSVRVLSATPSRFLIIDWLIDWLIHWSPRMDHPLCTCARPDVKHFWQNVTDASLFSLSITWPDKWKGNASNSSLHVWLTGLWPLNLTLRSFRVKCGGGEYLGACAGSSWGGQLNFWSDWRMFRFFLANTDFFWAY